MWRFHPAQARLLPLLLLGCSRLPFTQAVFESNWTGVRQLSFPKSLQAEYAGKCFRQTRKSWT